MKLIIKQYLASLRERKELDAVLPDLLSQLGLNVFSRPSVGTRQDGVDVAAVGKHDSEHERVFLFSIKPGDLTRTSWSKDSPQDLRPSLQEIMDAYIPNRMPFEHRDKPITVCICIGGDVQESVRAQYEGFLKQQKKANVTFETWNGDKLAELIQSNFLREDLLPPHGRTLLRKSLAMLDEPDVSHQHFTELMRSLSIAEGKSPTELLTAVRQISLCIWILYAWCREGRNLEAAYRCSEVALLHSWQVARHVAGRSDKQSMAFHLVFASTVSTYHQISLEFLDKCVGPNSEIHDGLASAVRGNATDVNLRLFDLLGRVSLAAIWSLWFEMSKVPKDQDTLNRCREILEKSTSQIAAMIDNNNALILPLSDNQVIEVCLASYVLILGKNYDYLNSWLTEMVKRAKFTYRTHGRYPTIITKYSELLDHPKEQTASYRERATQASVLYPTIALWAAALDSKELYLNIRSFQAKALEHCAFQLWLPDETTERFLYLNDQVHGAGLVPLPLDDTSDVFLDGLLAECDQFSYFEELSAIKCGFYPLVFVACRAYRLPIPPQMFRGASEKLPARKKVLESTEGSLPEAEESETSGT